MAEKSFYFLSPCKIHVHETNLSIHERRIFKSHSLLTTALYGMYEICNLGCIPF